FSAAGAEESTRPKHEVTEGRRDRFPLGPLLYRVDEGRFELVEAAVDQIFLGGKVVEHGRLGDVGSPRHTGDGDGIEAVLGEQLERRGGDGLARLLLFAFAQRWLGGHATILAPCYSRPNIRVTTRFE